MVQKTYVCKHRILNLVNNFVFHAFIDLKPSEKLSSLLTTLNSAKMYVDCPQCTEHPLLKPFTV